MNKELISSLMENFLHDCKKKTISKIERSEIIKKLLVYKNCSQRELAKEIGISHSTLHDWVSIRQDNTGDNIHISFTMFIRKIKNIDPKTFTDWGRLEQIKKVIEEKIRLRK